MTQFEIRAGHGFKRNWLARFCPAGSPYTYHFFWPKKNRNLLSAVARRHNFSSPLLLQAFSRSLHVLNLSSLHSAVFSPFISSLTFLFRCENFGSATQSIWFAGNITVKFCISFVFFIFCLNMFGIQTCSFFLIIYRDNFSIYFPIIISFLLLDLKCFWFGSSFARARFVKIYSIQAEPFLTQVMKKGKAEPRSCRRKRKSSEKRDSSEKTKVFKYVLYTNK